MRIAVSIVILALAAATARADDGPSHPADKGTLGIGIILGEPTGVTAKLYLKDDQAIQATAGSAFIGGGLQLTADYLFHPLILQDTASMVLPFYVGPGLRAIEYSAGRNGDTKSFAMGLRAVAGLLFDFKNVPLDAFVEVAGVFEYEFKSGEGVGAAINFGLGVRYYF
jgi:hypothetical protein